MDSPVTSGDEEGELHVSVDDLHVDTSSESLYIPTPTKVLWEHWVCVKVLIPDKMCFLELKQLETFVELLNSVRCCVTPGRSGVLIPSAVKSIGLGGAVSITFSCNHCLMHHIPSSPSHSQFWGSGMGTRLPTSCMHMKRGLVTLCTASCRTGMQ